MRRRVLSLGPRLLRAKTLFGDFMRACDKELVEMAKIIRSTMLRKLVQMSCRIYNSCKESTLEKIPSQILECLTDATQNTSSMFYTDLHMSEEFRLMSAKYMNCARKMVKSASVLPETMDDAIAYGPKAAFTFGWV
ncbi:uncharacterized protein [Dermacentor andersoni]|uniref:uncharacterized protein n=1 Tax=Dermacentor andersoni TaxID=34620 RepID=UPI003B3AC2D2